MGLLAVAFDVLTYLALSPMPSLMTTPTAGLSLSEGCSKGGTSNNPTLLGIPQELRNKIVSANADLVMESILTLVSSATCTTQPARLQRRLTWTSLQTDANAYREPAN